MYLVTSLRFRPDSGLTLSRKPNQEGSEFSVLPYWITMDGVRVEDDKHGTRTFNIGDKTFGNGSGSMHEVNP